VDRSGHFPAGVVATAAPARRADIDPLGRSDGRRDVFPSQKGGFCVAKTKRGKGTKIMLLVDGHGTPLGVDIASASPAEVKLIEPLLEKRVLRKRPERLIYDRAADSDPLRKRLAKRCIELICPHRRGRKRPARPRMDARFGDTNAAGRSSDRSVGCSITVGLSFATSGMTFSSEDS
jgi:hypothetical protein